MSSQRDSNRPLSDARAPRGGSRRAHIAERRLYRVLACLDAACPPVGNALDPGDEAAARLPGRLRRDNASAVYGASAMTSATAAVNFFA